MRKFHQEASDKIDKISALLADLRLIEIESSRTETKEISGVLVPFKWSLSFEEESMGITHEVSYNLSNAHAQSCGPHIYREIEAFADSIRTYLRSLTPNKEWPHSLADMGLAESKSTCGFAVGLSEFEISPSVTEPADPIGKSQK